MEFLKDIFGFIIDRKKLWLTPVIFALAVLGLVLVFGGGSAAAPFIYSLF